MMAPARGETAPATHVPKGVVSAAMTSMISPALMCTNLRFIFATLVVIEFGNMASNEVPRAIRSDAPNSIDNAGTASAPPPIPSNPAKVPMTTPNSTSPMPVTTLMKIRWSRDGVKIT